MPNHFQNTHTIVDTSAPLSLIAPNGYYEVGNKIFNYKIHALQEGSRTGLPVHWNFNDEVFNNFNWTKRLNIPLLELYRMRAQQIRQKYKWISLLWSGGADSTAMMESFLDNNIHLDEVVVLWPTSMSAGKYTPKWDRSRFNMMSEWDLTIKPGIERLQAKYPKLQITVVDTFEKPPTDEDREDTAIIVEKHSYGTIQKYRALDALLKQRVEKYDSVGTVVGSSPVELRILNNRFLATFFSDIAAYPASKTDITLDGWVRNMEFFYWSPEFPELIAKQAHVILDHINLVPKSRIFINQFSMDKNRVLQKTHASDSEHYRQFRKSLLYPNYPLDTFQVNKPEITHINHDWENWFHDNPHSEEFLTAYQSAIASQQSQINERFMIRKHGRFAYYKTFFSKLHIVGQLSEVTETVQHSSMII